MQNVKPKKLKIFVSHSATSIELLDDFVARLKPHNKCEALYDHNAAYGEIDDVILNYARECQIALLLINAKFIDSEYCNEIELPILIDRMNKEDLVVLPVLFEECEYKEWNMNNQNLFFLQARNSDFDSKRREGASQSEYNRRLVAYGSFQDHDGNDRERFHMILSKAIKKCLSDLNQKKK